MGAPNRLRMTGRAARASEAGRGGRMRGRGATGDGSFKRRRRAERASLALVPIGAGLGAAPCSTPERGGKSDVTLHFRPTVTDSRPPPVNNTTTSSLSAAVCTVLRAVWPPPSFLPGHWPAPRRAASSARSLIFLPHVPRVLLRAKSCASTAHRPDQLNQPRPHALQLPHYCRPLPHHPTMLPLPRPSPSHRATSSTRPSASTRPASSLPFLSTAHKHRHCCARTHISGPS